MVSGETPASRNHTERVENTEDRRQTGCEPQQQQGERGRTGVGG